MADLSQPPLLPSQNGTLEMKSPIFAARPGWGGRLSAWLKKIFQVRSAIYFLLAIGLVVGINWLARHRTAQPSATELPIDDMAIKTPGQAAVTASTGTVTLSAGQGLTHAARQVIRQYLEANNTTLTPEQKVYAEDYLRRHPVTPTKTLHPGQTVAFGASDITDSVTKALALPDDALKNLTKYAKKVSSF